MSHRSEVPPATVPVELTEGGVTVQYLDGREVFYHGVPERVTGSVRAAPGKEVHVLVTDPEGTEGAMFYVNDRTTHDDILEDTGVGRALVGEHERTQLFPGVEVSRDGHANIVEADPAAADGRVFVFVEDEFSEASYEIVAADGAGETEDENEEANVDETGGADGNERDDESGDR